MQSLFLPMKTLQYVGGYKQDLNIFALVIEDETIKEKFCYLFRWKDPVCYHCSNCKDEIFNVFCSRLSL